MFHIFLSNPDEAEEFVKEASESHNEINLESGSVAIDGKSLLGVLTMGVHRRLRVNVIGDDRDFVKRISRFVVA